MFTLNGSPAICLGMVGLMHKALPILRWALAALTAYCGIHVLVSTKAGLHFDLENILLLLFLGCLALPFFLTSYFCIRGQYRRMFSVIFFVVSLIVWGLASRLFNNLNWDEWMIKNDSTMPWMVIPALAFGLISLVGPIYAAIWTFRLLGRTTKHFEAFKPNAATPARPCGG